jgi:hypothetical protein
MIEKSILNYLLSDSTLISLLHGNNNIFYQRVPEEAEMPWVVFTLPPGGERNRMTQKYTNIDDVVSFDIESALMVEGRNIVGRVLYLIENYRGDMGEDQDLHITTTSIRSMDGALATFRYAFNAFVKYKEITTFPN